MGNLLAGHFPSTETGLMWRAREGHMLLENKVVLITGASAGIGRATAIGAARQGADIAFTHFDATDENASQTAKAIHALGRRAFALKQDVAEPESAPAFIQEAVRE